MPDLWIDVDVALTEVPVNILPLIDDGDFKTIEEAIAYNAGGMDLNWNFVQSDGTFTQTNVVPTTAGTHDWTHQGNGLYTLEIPDTGGTINNDTEGHGWFTGVCTGVLPWRGPVIGFRDAQLNDALIDSSYSTTRGLAGTALPDAAADAAGGLPISDAGGLDIDAIYTDTNELNGTKIPDTISLANINAQVDSSIETYHLDHLLAVDYNPAGKPGTSTALLNELVENDGGVSRFTTNALEQAPSSAGSSAIVMQSTTVTVSTQTSMVLAAGNTTDDDCYNDKLALITDQSTGTQKSVVRITDYDAGTLTITLEAAADFTVATGDSIDIFVFDSLTKAEVNTEADNAIETYNLDHLLKVAVTGADVTDDSVIAQMASASGTADWDTFDNTTDSMEAIGNTIAGVAGAGANTVTITVQDTEGPPNNLENATVKLSEGGNDYTATTNASGQAVFYLNNATYTYVIAKPNYAGATGSIVVSGTTNQTYSMAVNGSPSPATPGFSNGSIVCYDEEGSVEQGVVLYLQCTRGAGTDGVSLDTKIRSETSDVNGLITFTNLVQGATYQVWRGPDPSGTGGGLSVASAGSKVSYTVPAQTTHDIAEVLGKDE